MVECTNFPLTEEDCKSCKEYPCHIRHWSERMNNQLSFYKKEKTVTYTSTEVEKGIASYCCKEMEYACKQYNTKVKERYDKKACIFADSTIYNASTNQIGIHTHSAYNHDYLYGGNNYYNYKEFKYCPFCGEKIETISLIDKELK